MLATPCPFETPFFYFLFLSFGLFAIESGFQAKQQERSFVETWRRNQNVVAEVMVTTQGPPSIGFALFLVQWLLSFGGSIACVALSPDPLTSGIEAGSRIEKHSHTHSFLARRGPVFRVIS